MATISLKDCALGIELGSTRIKAVLIDRSHAPVASGSYDWENKYENGVWTYALSEVQTGLQGAFAALKADVQAKFGLTMTTVGAIGISGMMHGYLPFDRDGKLLAPFRTWRNTITGQAAAELSELFNFNIPQRWSIAHLYQAMLNGEAHVPQIACIETLAAYVHWQLTGERVIGIGEASGMFPIDSTVNAYDAGMLTAFNARAAEIGYPVDIAALLPRILPAGAPAGTLTADGAKLLDPAGDLQPGIPLCPPEGDAGTGMVATNAVAARTGNISAGTSIFLMAVLEHALSGRYEAIDMVTTPTGKPVAMVHCNNCSGEIDAWAGLLKQFCERMGCSCSIYQVLDQFFAEALEGDADCGGLVPFNYLSGEVITGLNSGRPLFVRRPDSRFTLQNFARAQLASAAATLSIGMEILHKENVTLDRLLGHGGYFKAPLAGQTVMAAALNTPVSVMKTAGEGGPWGMAILAAFMKNGSGETLEDYLDAQVFAAQDAVTVDPDPAQVAGYQAFLADYKRALAAEKAAVEAF
ncbi:MAG: ATPase [Clostridia bacterium]|nr:ATPase [Clostridia bacterium]